MKSRPTRQNLIKALQSDEQSELAWEDFLEIYEELILDWLAQQGVQYSDAEDIRQEVMTTVYKEIVHFEHNGREGAFRRWLRQITAHRAKRLWDSKSRQQKENSSLDLAEMADGLADDSTPLSRKWDQDHDAYVLSELLDRLGERFSETSLSAFQSVVIEQRDATEVAEELGISLGALRVAQHRVMRALKKQADASSPREFE